MIKQANELDLNNPKDGVYVGVSSKDYHSIRGFLSSSGLKHFRRSPAHFQAALKEPNEITDDRRIGTGVDIQVFTPQDYAALTAICGDRRGAKEKEIEATGVITLKQEQHERIQLVAEAVNSKMHRMRITGIPQLSVFITDPTTGARFKARPDLVNLEKGIIYDLKTCSDASEPAFRKNMMFRNSYHWQGFSYLLACSLAFGKKFNRFIIIAAETDAPFSVNIIEVGAAALEKAGELIVPHFGEFHKCSESGHWPEYQDEIVPCEIDFF